MDIEKILYDNLIEYFVTVERDRDGKGLMLLLESGKIEKDIDELAWYFISESRIELERFKQNLNLLIQVIKNNSNNKDEVEKNKCN